jgi:outer membrane protein X
MKASFFKKAAILLIAAVATTATVSAQKGSMAAGGSVVLGSGDSYTNYGIQGKFRYGITDPIRLEGSFTYFLKKDYTSMWDFSVNGHYLFPVGEKLTVYPLAGLGLLGVTVSTPTIDLGEWGSYGGSYSDSEFGFNLGGGLDYELQSNLLLNVELRYTIHDLWDRLYLSAGVVYKF